MPVLISALNAVFYTLTGVLVGPRDWRGMLEYRSKGDRHYLG